MKRAQAEVHPLWMMRAGRAGVSIRGMSATPDRRHVVVVGGGFAGVGCARALADRDDVRVTLIDRHNYHQFQPLLYQVATSQLAPSDVAYSLRKLFADHPNVDVKMADIVAVDPQARTATAADGTSWQGDVLVVAAGSQPNFFGTPGAGEHAFPLYSLDHATALRSRIIGLFEEADLHPERIADGALDFVVVGGGATGVESAGAIADLFHETMSAEYHDLAVSAATVHVVDLGHALLAPFSPGAHDYVAKALNRRGVQLHMGTAVKEVGAGHVTLSDGGQIRTRCVIWGGGIKGPAVAADSGLPLGRGGRVDVQPDLTVEGLPQVYALGDMANITGADGDPLPQLGSVAQQSGRWAAANIVADLEGKQRKPFHYRDKGIMAMIGRGAAVAEVGPHRHELHGVFAFSAWLGVHAMLMTGVRNRIDAFVDWGWDYFSGKRGPQVLDRSDAGRIDWDDDAVPAAAPVGTTHDGAGAAAG
jgi:NADH dehydrogenase